MLRVYSGNLKYKTIKTIDNKSLRPTSAKVRASIFNIIKNDVLDSNWLDLFAGSGIVGFEAISRGADSVTFVEKDPRTFKNLKSNIINLEIDSKTKTYKTDAINFLKRVKVKFNFIFADPPYSKHDYYKEITESVVKNKILKEGGEIIFEHEKKLNLSYLEKYGKLKTYNYGNSNITFLEV